MARLVELGHKRIAFFSTEPYNANFKSRIEEYHSAVKEYGLNAYERFFYMVQNGLMWYDETRKKARELCSSAHRPTTILCAGRTLAYGAWQGIMDAGLKIPENISVIGFDCEITVNPHLSTIVQPFYEMAQKTGELMLSILDGRNSCDSVFFNAFLDERGSSSKVPEEI